MTICALGVSPRNALFDSALPARLHVSHFIFVRHLTETTARFVRHL